jgi:hypothetical protein
VVEAYKLSSSPKGVVQLTRPEDVNNLGRVSANKPNVFCSSRATGSSNLSGTQGVLGTAIFEVEGGEIASMPRIETIGGSPFAALRDAPFCAVRLRGIFRHPPCDSLCREVKNSATEVRARKKADHAVRNLRLA